MRGVRPFPFFRESNQITPKDGKRHIDGREKRREGEEKEEGQGIVSHFSPYPHFDKEQTIYRPSAEHLQTQPSRFNHMEETDREQITVTDGKGSVFPYRNYSSRWKSDNAEPSHSVGLRELQTHTEIVVKMGVSLLSESGSKWVKNSVKKMGHFSVPKSDRKWVIFVTLDAHFFHHRMEFFMPKIVDFKPFFHPLMEFLKKSR